MSFEPLTTVFTPPSSCFDLQTLTLPPFGADDFEAAQNTALYSFGYQSLCYPADFDQVVIYYPGILPYGFETRRVSLHEQDLIVVTGCYLDYSLDTFVVDDKTLVGCWTGIATGLVVIDDDQTSTAVLDLDQDVLLAGYRPIVIAYDPNESPLPPITSTLSSTTTTKAMATPKITTTLPRATDPPAGTSPAPDLRSKSLSKGAKAGIGAGTVICVMAFIIGIVVMLRRRRRRILGGPGYDGKTELHGESKTICPPGSTNFTGNGKVNELDGSDKPIEMGNDNVRAELEGDWVGWEAPVAADQDDIAGAIQYIQIHD